MIVAGSGGGGGGGGSPYDRLVVLSGAQTASGNFWLDTAAPGDVLATTGTMMIGATYSVRLFTQPNWVQPPADAVAIVGNQIRAGAGFASVYSAAYVLEIVNETTGLTSHILIDVLSNRAANVTVSTPAALTGALDAAKAKLIAEGASYTGYVIDVTPGIDYGDIRYNLGKPNASQVRQTIIRNADPNRLNPASRPKFQHLSMYNCRYPVVQRLLLESGNLQPRALSACRNIDTGDGNGTTVDFAYIVGNRARGGALVYTGTGGAFVDHTQTIDPTNDWHESFTFFDYALSFPGGNTQFDRMDLYVGHTATKQLGGPIGTWNVATTPAYVGANTPNGQAGVFGGPGSGHWLTNNWPNNNNPPVPAAFDAMWEVAYLDSTPRNTTYGGSNRVKPAGGPDGNYVVAWKLGSAPGVTVDRTIAGASAGGNGALRWLNQVTYYVGESRLPTAFSTDSNGRYQHLIFSRNHVSEVGNVIFQYQIMETNHCLWTVNNFVEMFARDAFQSIWSASGPYNNPQIWNPGFGHFHAFNFAGRAIMRESDFNNPHGDTLQAFDGISYSEGGGEAQPWLLLVGNIQFTKTGRLGAGYQGPFLSDLGRLTPPFGTTNTAGYRLVSVGNFIDANEGNAWSLTRLQVDLSAYNTVLNRYGSSNEFYTLNPDYPPAIHYQKVIWGTLHTQTLGAFGSFSKRYIDGKVGQSSTPGVWANPDQTFTSDIATLRARYTAIGDNVGYGAFADPEQVIDHIAKVWNPNIHEFRLLSEPVTGAATSTWTPSTVRQVLYGTKPKQVSVSGCQWSKGATRAAALAAARTSSPGTISVGEWIVVWVQSSANGATTASGTLTVDGIASVFDVTTASTFAMPAGGNIDNITPAAQYVSPTGASGVQTAFASLSIPNGSGALIFVAVDRSVASAQAGPNIDWVEPPNSSALAGTGASSNFGQMFWWFNDTGSTVSRTFALDAGSNEFSAEAFIIPRTTPTNRLAVTCFASSQGSSASPNMGSCDTGVVRSYLWFHGITVDQTGTGGSTITAAPADYRVPGQSAPSFEAAVGLPNTESCTIGVAMKMTTGTASEDPGAWTLSAAKAVVRLMAAVYEDVL